MPSVQSSKWDKKVELTSHQPVAPHSKGTRPPPPG